MVVGEGGHWAFTLAAPATLTLHLHTGNFADEISWMITQGMAGETVVASGPTGHQLTIGMSSSGWGGMLGYVAAASAHSFAVGVEEAECLYQAGQDHIASCRDPLQDDLVEWLIFNQTLGADVSLEGDAYVDGKFGVQLDGDGDSIVVGGELAAGYADNTWSINMWFTRRECLDEGRFEMLYAHKTTEDGRWWGEEAESNGKCPRPPPQLCCNPQQQWR